MVVHYINASTHVPVIERLIDNSYFFYVNFFGLSIFFLPCTLLRNFYCCSWYFIVRYITNWVKYSL